MNRQEKVHPDSMLLGSTVNSGRQLEIFPLVGLLIQVFLAYHVIKNFQLLHKSLEANEGPI